MTATKRDNSEATYSPLRIRSSGTFPGQTRNTGQCPVFRRGAADRNTGQCPVFRSCSGRGRTETQDSVLCSGRVLAFMAQGPGEAQPYIGLLPRAGRSCCVVSAPRLHRLPHHPLHGRGAGCVLQSPLYPLWRLQCFLGQTGSNQTKGAPPPLPQDISCIWPTIPV